MTSGTVSSFLLTGPFLEPRSREHQTEWPTAEEARGRPQLAAYQSGKPDRAALPKLRGGGSRRGESSTDLQKIRVSQLETPKRATFRLALSSGQTHRREMPAQALRRRVEHLGGSSCTVVNNRPPTMTAYARTTPTSTNDFERRSRSAAKVQ
jgi:hypothetical protein